VSIRIMITMRVWRDVLLSMALAAAAPTMSQTAGLAAGPALGSAPTVASVPDFSGVWRHSSLPWFAPPASGAGPVTNRSVSGTRIFLGLTREMTSRTSGKIPNLFDTFSRSRSRSRLTQSGTITGAEPICSAASSSGFLGNRLTILPARRCFIRWGSAIGSGEGMKMVGFQLPPVFVCDLAMQQRSVRSCSITAIGTASKSSPQHGSNNQ
jgi:hypothetical protein